MGTGAHPFDLTNDQWMDAPNVFTWSAIEEDGTTQRAVDQLTTAIGLRDYDTNDYLDGAIGFDTYEYDPLFCEFLFDYYNGFCSALADAVDVDMRAFSLSQGTNVHFRLTNTGFADPGADIRLFNSAGVELAQNPAIGQDNWWSNWLPAGSYYFGIAGAGNSDYDSITGHGDQPMRRLESIFR